MCSDFENTLVISNRQLVHGDFLTKIAEVLRLKPHGLILREKYLSDEEYEELAKAVMELCAEQDVTCFLHSKIDIAQRLGCRNLHMSIPALRALYEENEQHLYDICRLSVSCHSFEDIEYAVNHGASQIILGTIFETECKKGLTGKGIAFVREACSMTDVPIYAIGGITPEKLPELMAAGAAGGCMMSWFMQYEQER